MSVIICEIAKERHNSTFYRYNVCGVKVWFEQYDDGSIYSTYSSNLPFDDIDVSVITEAISVNENSDYSNIPYTIFYPTDCSVYIKAPDMSFNNGDIDKCIMKMQYCKDLSALIMSIFDMDVHKSKLVRSNNG